MKSLILALVSSLSIIVSASSYAALMDCYAGANHFYHDKVDNVRYSDIYVEFREKKTHNVLVTNAICLIRLNKHDK